jgi:microcystin degradation protein MlrC
MVYADGDRAKADGAAARVIAKLREVRDRLFVTLPSAAAGIGEAVALARRPQGGPIAVIDAADHPGAGAIGDTPEFLRELLAARPPVPAAFVFFADPSIVRRAHQAGAGGAIAGTLGGRLTDIYGPPVPFEGRVLRLTDGRFRNRGPVQHGMETDFGPTAVLDVSGVHIVVTTLCKSVMDPAFFDLHGIDLAQLGILAIKAKNQFRAAFLDVFRRMIDIDTPGPACLDFSGLPYRRVPRPIYPLDRNVG